MISSSRPDAMESPCFCCNSVNARLMTFDRHGQLVPLQRDTSSNYV
jgi:hypothetical protein